MKDKITREDECCLIDQGYAWVKAEVRERLICIDSSMEPHITPRRAREFASELVRLANVAENRGSHGT